jgi:transcriptional regulator with XRE-family HTH domain
MEPKRAPLPEIYMKLIHRKRLLTLMTVNDVSQRQLALAAGYRSHAYMGRLLRGEVDTLEPEAALRIARFFRVGVDDLFVPRLSTDAGRSAQRRPVKDPVPA